MSNQREILSRNLRDLIDSRGIDQRVLAEHLGLSEMAVSHWVNGVKYPRMTNIQKIADYFGVMKSDIIEDKGNKRISTYSNYNYIPTAISAGLPIEVEGITNDQVKKISIPDALMGRFAGHQDIFVTKISGESMNKIIPDESLIAVKPVTIDELKTDDIVVYRKDNDYAVKRLIIDDDRLIFKPESTDNRFFDDVIQIDKYCDITIKGKVVLYIVELS